MAYQPTTNFGWAMPRGGDQAQISVINQQFTAKADEIVYQTRRMIAPGYIDDGTKTYHEGDIVEFENVDYVCTGTTSGAWDSSKWDSTDMATQIQEAKESGGTNVEANPVEAATADLHKLKVDTTVYGIPDPTVTKTATGNPIEFSDGADAPLVKCVSEITGSQDLHGYDKPWVGGAGKNKFDGNYPNINAGIQYRAIYLGSGTFTMSTTCPETTSTASNLFFLSGNVSSGASTSSNGVNRHVPRTVTAVDGYVTVAYRSNEGVNPQDYNTQIESGSTATPYSPYSNICPIIAYTEGKIEVSDGDGNTTTHTTTYPYAIYRGSEDVVNGSTSYDKLKIVFTGAVDENWNTEEASVGRNFYINISDALPLQYAGTGLLSNIFEASPLGAMRVDKILISNGKNLNVPVGGSLGINTVADWKTWLSTHNLEVVYNTAPTTTPVTPTNLPIKSLSGYTHIESTTGEMEVEYITEGYQPLVDLIQWNQHIYSTQEQIVGKWVDGSDLYERTFELSNPSQSGDISTGQTYDIVFVVSGYYMLNDGNSILSANQFLNVSNYTYVHVEKDGDIKYNITGYTATKLSVTIRYTKASSNNRSLSKGATGGLKADLSEEKKEIEESVDKVDKVDETTETIEEKEENAGESNSENER